jgi:hypothetical protein
MRLRRLRPFGPQRAQFEQITIAQASVDKDTRVENSTQSSKAALLLVVCRCQQLLRRALKAEDKLQGATQSSKQASRKPASDSFS